ncbi:hypothetical protein F5Y04DRAFT_92641 [Hypomontagnella monticulosa]|nr:hypothetical protein F5Y04DRAFT_92641 [Hypomontagnella monticulosa]
MIGIRPHQDGSLGVFFDLAFGGFFTGRSIFIYSTARMIMCFEGAQERGSSHLITPVTRNKKTEMTSSITVGGSTNCGASRYSYIPNPHSPNLHRQNRLCRRCRRIQSVTPWLAASFLLLLTFPIPGAFKAQRIARLDWTVAQPSSSPRLLHCMEQ